MSGKQEMVSIAEAADRLAMNPEVLRRKIHSAGLTKYTTERDRRKVLVDFADVTEMLDTPVPVAS